MLRQNPGAAIFYDLRSSWAVKETIEAHGGKPMMSRVGHAFIKQQMREADAERVLATLKERYGSQGRAFELDGLSVEFDTWWFNVRCSNTEPLIRLNLEAKTEAEMAAKRDEILAVIRG